MLLFFIRWSYMMNTILFSGYLRKRRREARSFADSFHYLRYRPSKCLEKVVKDTNTFWIPISVIAD